MPTDRPATAVWHGRAPGVPEHPLTKVPIRLIVQLDEETKAALRFGLDAWKARGVVMSRHNYVRFALRHAAGTLATQANDRAGLFAPAFDKFQPKRVSNDD